MRRTPSCALSASRAQRNGTLTARPANDQPTSQQTQTSVYAGKGWTNWGDWLGNRNQKECSHRASKLMPHREFLEAARTEKSDITLQALCDRLLAERGIKSDTSMMSRFFRKIGVTLKKEPRRA